jgi:NAD(P)-dependent dehydrogenase (short-subunit alcohol dehydrogenase family)
MLLEDKVVCVTGVGPGLGRALVLEAAAEGAAVACMARTASYVQDVVAEVEATGGRALATPGDITSADDRTRVVGAIEERFGRLDGLVNSAFRPGAIAPLEDVDLDDWRQTFEVNVFGTLGVIRAALPLLKTGGGGAVVNINTMSAFRPMAYQGGYGGSKAALEFLTRQMAVELGSTGIRFNTVYCGPMLGPNLEMAFDSWAEARGETVDEVKAAVATTMALGRIPEDDDAAKAIVLLLSDNAAVLTGTAVQATGGAWLDHRI